jgi:predicted TPR repeat methyltransferase
MRSKPWWVLRVSKAHLDALAAAYALGLFGEDIGVALALVDRALHLNPNFAWAWVRSGWLRLWAGEHDTGIKHCETSIRLSPRESKSAPYLGIGMGYLFKTP